jgi:hypothetical protein
MKKERMKKERRRRRTVKLRENADAELSSE